MSAIANGRFQIAKKTPKRQRGRSSPLSELGREAGKVFIDSIAEALPDFIRYHCLQTGTGAYR